MAHNIHTVEFKGTTYTRTSQNRTYTHAVAVVHPAFARDGYISQAWEGVLSWSSSEKLAHAAASTARNQYHYNGTERVRHGRRQRVIGNGPAVYSEAVVLPVTRTVHTPKASSPVVAAKANATRKAKRWGAHAVASFRTVQGDPDLLGSSFAYHLDWAARAARYAWREANVRLSLEGGQSCAFDPTLVPTDESLAQAHLNRDFARSARVED